MLTGIEFDMDTFYSAALLVLSFLALKYSARAVVQLLRNAAYYNGYDDSD